MKEDKLLSLEITIPSLHIPVEVELGNPRRDCQNFGICRIYRRGKSPSKTGSDCGCGCKVEAELHCTLSRMGIVLVFPKENLRPEVIERHFGRGLFVMEASFHLPPKLAGEMGFAAYIIFPGEYLVLDADGAFTVIF